MGKWGGGGGSWSSAGSTLGGAVAGGAAGGLGGTVVGALGGNAYGRGGDPRQGGDGGGFSIGGMGGKSGALGKYDVLGKQLDNANPWLQADKERQKAKEEAEQRAQELYEQTLGLNKNLDAADTGYKGAFDTASNKYLNGAYASVHGYQTKINDLNQQSKDQAADATKTYKGTIQPELMNALDMSKKNAQGAMTLEEAMDPNNKLQTSIRGLYDQMGRQYSDERLQQGRQDFGVLSALGVQAAGQQFGVGAGPMTAGMQGQIYARGQEQAGNAYAKAQQDAYARMKDLQQQGINRGFDQNNWAYEQGQQAQDRYSNSIGNIQNAEHNYNADQQGFRGEQSGYAGDMLGTQQAYNTDVYNMGMTGAGIDRDNAYAGTGRQQNALNQKYGADQQAANNNLAMGQANNASKGQFISSMLGMFAGGFGGAGKSMISNDTQNPWAQNQGPQSNYYYNQNTDQNRWQQTA